jgi:hypothetical protein
VHSTDENRGGDKASGQDFMQFEPTARRETTLLIDARHARHFSFGLQLQILQSAVCQGWKVDFQIYLSPLFRGQRADYKNSRDADIECAANTPLVLTRSVPPRIDNLSLNVETNGSSLLHRPHRTHRYSHGICLRHGDALQFAFQSAEKKDCGGAR